MSDLDYAPDDLLAPTGLDALILRFAKRKGFLAKRLWGRSKKIFGHRSDLARHFALRRFGIRVGKYTYGFRPFLHDGTLIKEIGAFCSIAQDVRITFAPHPLGFTSTHPAFYDPAFKLVSSAVSIDQITHDVATTTIGHDVWIGTNVTLIAGVKIGTGAVIGAGAVVTKDVPPYAIVAGVPARMIRSRFDERTIERLLESRWWTWPDLTLRQKQPDLLNPKNIQAN